ncbi:DUF1835 domain-containing protein [Burkholderia sp. AW49-1]
MSDLHLVGSMSAAGALRYASNSLGLIGDVLCFGDDYAIGPLSMELRPAFWQRIHRACPSPDDLIPESNLNPSDALRQLIERNRAERVIIWTS